MKKLENLILMTLFRLMIIFYIIILSGAIVDFLNLKITGVIFFLIFIFLYFKYLDPEFKKHL